MSWIRLSDENSKERLSQETNGQVIWDLKINSSSASGLEVNGERLRKHLKRAGLNKIHVYSATLDSSSSVNGNINSDGTISATKIRNKVTTNRPLIEREVEDTHQIATRSPDISVEIDLDAIIYNLPNGKNDYGKHWAKELDNSIKSSILQASVRHNIIDASGFTVMQESKNKKVSATLMAVKQFSMLGGSLNYTVALYNPNRLPTAVLTALVWNYAVYASENYSSKAIKGQSVDIKDFKPSLFPVIPVDRALAAGIQKIGARPFIRNVEISKGFER